ncbi:histidine utilization protein HutD [Achromobacter sp. HZ28]|nr:histidine utilization protein HutD [Achromobacter sp. HZ34]OWT82571.1 histidine utilization protein HutD [Achromobacter sp. HZ28]
MTGAVTPFRLADVPAQPWKNGGGTTREIACWPPGASVQDFLWRISVARIDAAGPFSRFADVDRVITLLSGAGVMLRGGFPAQTHALTETLLPFAFPGDVDVDCVLQGGASEDFNVMSRRGAVRARVTVIWQAGELPAASHGLLLAVGGGWEVHDAGTQVAGIHAATQASGIHADPGGDGACHSLAPDAGLWWAQTSQAWRVKPAADNGSGLIAVSFDISAVPHPTGGDGHAPQPKSA